MEELVYFRYSLKWYYDQKISSFFPSDFESVFTYCLTGKILSFEFYPKAVFLSVSFGFYGPPLLTFKTERENIRGLDLVTMTSITY